MSFDPDLFMSASVTGASSTQVEQCPAGEFTAVADDLLFDSFQGTKDPSKTYHKMTVVWSIDDPAVKEQLGRDKITVRQDLFLDLNPSGGLDMGRGKNVSLGRLREALGQNDASRAWAPSMLKGNVAKVKVEHEIVKGEPFARVTGVMALS